MPYTLPPNPIWFITGCSSGLGLSLATHLSQNTTSRIIATARTLTSLASLPTTPNILKLALDVTSDESIQAALAAAVNHFGGIDVVVNNAGFNILAEAELVAPEAARSILETNFWGAVRVSTLAIPILRNGDEADRGGERRGGVILQITSVGARLAFAGNSFYHASKFALEGFTEALDKELAPEWNIHVCCVEPGGVRTEYAHRAVSSPAAQEALGKTVGTVYADPNSQTNWFRRQHEDPRAMEGWADPDVVSRAVYAIVRDGVPGKDGTREIPLRVPLGADSWALQKKGLEVGLERLERTREIAVGVSGDRADEQLESIAFLTM